MNKNTRLQEKLRRVVELMAKKQLKEYESNPPIALELDTKSNKILLKEKLDDFYLMADTLIAQYYGVDMLKFREMFNLLFTKYETIIDEILENMEK